MHLFLIRHGETEHNVAGLLAGVTDSNLTNHGIFQAQKLGKYLISTRNLQFTHLYASDLKRAWMTAEEIKKAQSHSLKKATAPAQVTKLSLLREQDFGSLELVPWSANRIDRSVDPRVPDPTAPGFKPKETPEAMRARADRFLDDFVSPLLTLDDDSNEECVAIVSHGLFLSCLWRALLSRFRSASVILGPDIGPVGVGRPIEHLPGWSNTGYLEVSIRRPSAPTLAATIAQPIAENTPAMFLGFTLTVLAINGKDHLLNLKRTRGGVGSATYDARQKNIDRFFKRSDSADQKNDG